MIHQEMENKRTREEKQLDVSAKEMEKEKWEAEKSEREKSDTQTDLTLQILVKLPTRCELGSPSFILMCSVLLKR